MSANTPQTPGDWKDYLEPTNDVMKLMAGQSVSAIPAQPICEDVPSLPFQYQRIIEKWAERAKDSGGKVDVTWDEYVKVRLEVYDEIFANYVPAPGWVSNPVCATKAGIEGATVEMRGTEAWHITKDGREVLMGDTTGVGSDAILGGAIEQTWDSTLGFKSFKENDSWEPEVNRVEKFKAGDFFEFGAGGSWADEDATGSGDCFDPEGYLPHKCFTASNLGDDATADERIASGNYDVVKAIVAKYGDQKPVWCGCTSPFQNSCYQLGFEGLMESMYLEPELVHQATEIYLPKPSVGHEVQKRTGRGILYMYQMFGGGDLFGPKQFEQFVAPVVQKALDFFHERGFWVVYYPMGNATPHLEPMADLDWDALSLEESRKGYVIDIAEARRVMGPDRLLFGNMDVSLIETGNKDAMLKNARYQIENAGKDGRFILSCGTPIQPGTPADYIKYFCDLPNLV